MAQGVAPDMAHIKLQLLKPRKYDNINFFNLNYEENPLVPFDRNETVDSIYRVRLVMSFVDSAISFAAIDTNYSDKCVGVILCKNPFLDSSLMDDVNSESEGDEEASEPNLPTIEGRILCVLSSYDQGQEIARKLIQAAKWKARELDSKIIYDFTHPNTLYNMSKVVEQGLHIFYSSPPAKKSRNPDVPE